MMRLNHLDIADKVLLAAGAHIDGALKLGGLFSGTSRICFGGGLVRLSFIRSEHDSDLDYIEKVCQ